MNHERRERILQRIREIETSIRVNRPAGWTMPEDVLAPVVVFVGDHIARTPGGWLSVSTIHSAFRLWLAASGQAQLDKKYGYAQFGRCLGQVLGMRSERKRIKRHQVRGYPVMGVHVDVNDFFFARMFE